MTISQAVGNSCPNIISDVKIIQGLLNHQIAALAPHQALKIDGDCGPVTIGLIEEYQKRVVLLKRPDGKVDPGGITISFLTDIKTIPSTDSLDNFPNDKVSQRILTEQDYQSAATLLEVEIATIKAVAFVESDGGGFLKDGKAKILFEGHWFSKLTQHQYDSEYPTISYKKWTKKYYKGGSAEYLRYNAAKTLNVEAAMKATSWGKFQIMGFNCNKCGYTNVTDFVSDMSVSESFQLMAFVKFLQSTKLAEKLKVKDWAGFAKGYNGPAYAKNQYDTRLKRAYTDFSTKE